MGELFKTRADAQVELVKSSGGVFEITVDGDLAYSKKQTGRFPENRELHRMLGG